MSETKQVDIRESGNLTNLMVKYSIPCITSLLVGALYNIVDQIFIANASYLGSYGNAANSVVYPLTVICLAIAVTFGDGGGSFLSISLGARQNENAHRSVGSCVSTVLCISFVLTIIYAVFQEPLLTMFGGRVNEETFQLAKDYLTWITVGVPFYMFGQGMAGIISADGNPRYSMLCTLTGAIVNIILDPIFIYVFRWRMKGAAIATITGQILVAILFLAYLPRMKSVKLHKESFRIRGSLLKKVIPLGANSFFAQASIVLSMAAVLNMVKVYGALDPVFGQEEYSQIPTAVIGIVMKFFQIVVSIAIGISAGALPIVGYNVGAKRNDRVIGLLKRILIAEAAVGVVACIVFEAFPRQLIGLFGSANESSYYTDFAVTTIRIFLSMIILCCLNKGIMIFMQALGKAKYAITISVLREIVFGVGLPLLLPLFFGLDGILYFMPLADILTFIVAAILISLVYKELSSSVDNKVISPETETSPGTPSFESAEPARTDYIITIGRSYGSGGRSIGKQLAKQLNIPYYDDKIIALAAENNGMSQAFFESLDEKPADVSLLYLATGYDNKNYQSFEIQALRAQEEIIRNIADEGACVIIGRRADQILRGNKKTLSVFVSGSPEERAKRVSERDGISLSESRKKIVKVDRERATYYNQYSDSDWGAARTYDLCVDTSKLGVDGAVDVIISTVKILDFITQVRKRS